MPDRILTTHAGSLPRDDDLGALIRKKALGETVDETAFAARVTSAVADVVRRQAEAGIDIVADGEMGRIGFIPYVNERLAGIDPSRGPAPANYWNESREYRAFPGKQLSGRATDPPARTARTSGATGRPRCRRRYHRPGRPGRRLPGRAFIRWDPDGDVDEPNSVAPVKLVRLGVVQQRTVNPSADAFQGSNP